MKKTNWVTFDFNEKCAMSSHLQTYHILETYFGSRDSKYLLNVCPSKKNVACSCVHDRKSLPKSLRIFNKGWTISQYFDSSCSDFCKSFVLHIEEAWNSITPNWNSVSTFGLTENGSSISFNLYDYFWKNKFFF